MTPRLNTLRVSAVLCALWAAASMTACSGDFAGVSDGSATYSPPEHSVEAGEESGSSDADNSSQQAYDGAQSDSLVEAREAVVVTGYWEVETGSPDEAAQRLIDAAQDAGGRISSSETTTYQDAVMTTVTVRVPTDRYQDVVDALPEYGEVVESTTESEDVGQEIVDLEARIKALETSVERLTEMLESSDSLADVIEVERTLAERQGELDSLRAQKRYLDDQVALSTLTVAFSENARANLDGPGVWEQARDAFLASLSALVIVALGLLPWLVVLTLVGWAIAALVRRHRTRPRSAERAGSVERAETAKRVEE